jgi:hypothetical protein
MGISAEIYMRNIQSDEIQIEILAEEQSAIIIGHRGEALQSLQYVVNRMINRGNEERKISVTLDISGYLKRREEQLIAQARRMARKVRTTGREEITEQLLPAERRIIHISLAGDSDLMTYSLGDGTLKRLVVALADSEHSRLQVKGVIPGQIKRSLQTTSDEGKRYQQEPRERKKRELHGQSGKISVQSLRPTSGEEEHQDLSATNQVRDLVTKQKTKFLKSSKIRIIHLPHGYHIEPLVTKDDEEEL